MTKRALLYTEMVTAQAIRNGLAMVELPGRFQIVPGQPTLVLDVAHNPHAARALARALPVIRSFVSLAAGFIDVPPLLFGVLSLIGTAVWVTAVSLIGYGVGSAWRPSQRQMPNRLSAVSTTLVQANAGALTLLERYFCPKLAGHQHL